MVISCTTVEIVRKTTLSNQAVATATSSHIWPTRVALCAWKAFHADAHTRNTTFQSKISPKAKSMFGWIDLVVNGNNSLRIWSDPLPKVHLPEYY